MCPTAVSRMKSVALLLLLANVLWVAWANDALAPWGWTPEHAQQPERLEQQLRSDALQPVIITP
jgi:hypothetical protein